MPPRLAYSVGPPASASACSTFMLPRTGYAPAWATSPSTKNLAALISETCTETTGSFTIGASLPVISRCSSLAVRPSAVMSPIIGSEIFPSGRTGSLAESAGSFHTSTATTSSLPMRYSATGAFGGGVVSCAQPATQPNAVSASPNVFIMVTPTIAC